jgi:hypothetical protein
MPQGEHPNDVGGLATKNERSKAHEYPGKWKVSQFADEI